MSEIIIGILKKWKLILVLAVIFAVILGGYKFISLYGLEIPEAVETDTSKLTYEEYTEQLEFNKEKLEKTEKQKNKLKDYAATSPLMEIDPYNCAYASRTCIVLGESKNIEAAAIDLATIAINIDYKLAGVARGTELENLDTPYLSELINVKMPMDNFQVDTPRFTITVIAKDKNTASTILSNVIRALSDYPTELHAYADQSFISLNWTADQSSTYYNADLLKTQTSVYDNISNLTDQINKTKTTIADLEKTYGKIYGEGYIGENKPIKSHISFSSAAKSSVKYAVIGLVLGVFIAIVFIFCKVLFQPILYCSSQLKDEANIKYIGNIENNESLKGINRLNKKIAGDKAFLSSYADRIAYTATKLSSIAKDSKILVTGTACTEDVDKAIALLKEAEPSLNLVFKGNLTVSAAAVKELSDAAGILIMEQAGKSKIKPLASLLEACRFTEKDIVGYVMI